MSLIQNFNVNPYYDDYDEDKKFLKILFRPGYALQARELTQLQTILQKQIERFGNHIFKNGSVVTGGEVSFSSSVFYHKLQTNDVNGNPINVNNFLGKTITSNTSLLIAPSTKGIGKVVAVAEATETDPPTIYVQYKTSFEANSNSTIYTADSNSFSAIVETANSTGKASIASINDGVYYIDGAFVKVSKQTIILDKYTNIPTYRVGLQFTDSVITEYSDTSLLDPALEASNYQAPGANRYKIDLILTKKNLDSEDDTKFFEIVRVEDGKIIASNLYPLYADLEKTLARRTYDESGNYTVKTFALNLKNHVPKTGNTANSELLTASLSPGKAYIKGYELETLAPINLDIPRSRTTKTVNNYDVEANYGNYLEVANVKGLIQVSTMPTYYMHCVDAGNVNTANANTFSATEIGTVRIKQLEYVSAANTQLPDSYKYDLYVFDTRFTPITANATGGNTTSIILSGNGFAAKSNNAYVGASIRITKGSAGDNVKRVITDYDASNRRASIASTLPFTEAPTANSVYNIDFNIKNINSFITNTSSAIVSSANISLTNKHNGLPSGDTFFSDTDFDTLVFRVPESFVAFGMSDQSYRGRRIFSNQTVTSGSLSLATGSATQKFVGSGALSETQKLEHFMVVANNATGSEFTSGQVIPFVGSSRSISVSTSTATLNFNSSNTFTVDVIASVDYDSATPRTKTLVTGNTTAVATSGGTAIGNTTVYLNEGQIAISTPNKVKGFSDNLYIADILKLEDRFEEEYGLFTGPNGKISFKVIDSGNTQAAVTTSDLNNSSKDITSRYTLNTGQKDNYYDHGSITLKSSANPPTGQILVIVSYFTHTGSGYLTVDSYNVASLSANTDVRYARIPSFSSPTTGETYQLRDCVDFRPIKTNATNVSPNFTLSGISIPKAEESLVTDYNYYLPRRDRIQLTDDKRFEVLIGVPSLDPQTPKPSDKSMSLYTLFVQPYTFFPSDVAAKFIENKRYTMQDIGRIDARVKNLEYYTSLNTLEKAAQDLTILDDQGLERFKNGILVDSFSGHSVGDVKNVDYACSMDFTLGQLRPKFDSNNIEFFIDKQYTTANISAGSIITTPYTVKPLITQNVASTGLLVNPFALSSYSGIIDLSPSSDFWVDKETRPDVLVNLEGSNDAWESLGPGAFGTQWGDWDEYVSGVDKTQTNTIGEVTEGYKTYQTYDAKRVKTTTYSRARSGTQNYIVPERVVESIGPRQVDLSIIPYCRPRDIIFVAKNLRPNWKHFVFFDNVPVSKYIQLSSKFWLYDVNGTFEDTFGAYETVTSSSGGTATVVKQVGRSWALTHPLLHLIDLKGNFLANDTITGATSGATAKISVPFVCSGLVTGANTNSVTLGSGSQFDNWYNDRSTWENHNFASPVNYIFTLSKNNNFGNDYLRIVAGTGVGQERTIISYNGTTKVAMIDKAWDVVPDSTSVWTVAYIGAGDTGVISGKFHLPNYAATSYDNGAKFTTGQKLFRIVNSPKNIPIDIKSLAETYYHSSGLLNVVENVSVSVRVPKLQTKVVYDEEDNYRQESAVTYTYSSRKLIRDDTPPPPPPPPTPTYYGDLSGGDGATGCSSDSTSSCADGGGGGGGCFIAGTLITMYDGTTKPIETIVSGDLVLDALTGQANEVIGVKSIDYEIGRKIFATEKGVTPFITEEHPFYNDKLELCAINEQCEYLAPWLGPVKIVKVPKIIVNDKEQLVYNLMFKTGHTHYANGVKVDNIVGTGNTYVLYMKGYISKEVYLGYINHLENTVGINALSQEQKARVFDVISKLSNYVLYNDNIRSKIIAKFVSWCLENRTILYPILEKWLKSRLRNWIFKERVKNYENKI